MLSLAWCSFLPAAPELHCEAKISPGKISMQYKIPKYSVALSTPWWWQKGNLSRQLGAGAHLQESYNDRPTSRQLFAEDSLKR